MAKILNALQAGASSGARDNTVAFDAIIGASGAIAFIPSGTYAIASQVTFPPGSLSVNGGFCWTPRASVTGCVDLALDLKGQPDNIMDCAPALASATGPSATSWVHIGPGIWKIGASVTIAPGGMLVSGALRWLPAPVPGVPAPTPTPAPTPVVASGP